MELERVNEIIKGYRWLDFELSNAGMDRLLLHGFVDEAEQDVICIEFHDVESILCKTHFTYEGKGNFIEEASGDEAYVINKGYSVSSGNKVFKIMNTDIDKPMYIIAKGIR